MKTVYTIHPKSELLEKAAKCIGKFVLSPKINLKYLGKMLMYSLLWWLQVFTAGKLNRWCFGRVVTRSPCAVSGLKALTYVVQQDPNLALQHQMTIIECLDHPDPIIKREVWLVSRA